MRIICHGSIISDVGIDWRTFHQWREIKFWRHWEVRFISGTARGRCIGSILAGRSDSSLGSIEFNERNLFSLADSGEIERRLWRGLLTALDSAKIKTTSSLTKSNWINNNDVRHCFLWITARGEILVSADGFFFLPSVYIHVYGFRSVDRDLLGHAFIGRSLSLQSLISNFQFTLRQRMSQKRRARIETRQHRRVGRPGCDDLIGNANTSESRASYRFRERFHANFPSSSEFS